MSCNPATQACDLALLCGSSRGPAGGFAAEASAGSAARAFRLESMQAADMLPHTSFGHVGTAAVLERKKARLERADASS